MKYLLTMSFLILISGCQRNTDKVKIEIEVNGEVKYLDSIPSFEMGSLIDKRDGKIYSTINIGKQIWTVDNIEYASTKGKKYRDHLYNWEAAENAIITPFEIPTENDWNELFEYIYDSIIINLSPTLLKQISETHLNYYSGRGHPGLPYDFKIDSTVLKLKDSNLETANKDEAFMPLMFFFLEKIGFNTNGSGFRYNNGLGVDDYSYFWTSTKDKSGDYKYVRIYTGSYCQGCGHLFGMPYNSENGYNLRLIKKE